MWLIRRNLQFRPLILVEIDQHFEIFLRDGGIRQ
jgi:hypothetical protein